MTRPDFNPVSDVAAFHASTDCPILTAPTFPAPARLDLREGLIVEECLKELLPAIARRDMVGIFDGAVDTIYVIVGLCLELGIPLAEGWVEVQRSNMAKAVLQPDGSYKVLRRPDGKVLKPEGWTPPDLASILRAHGWKEESEKAR
jgi:predicted HAD superfamily Cof-like phosphohydrolase